MPVPACQPVSHRVSFLSLANPPLRTGQRKRSAPRSITPIACALLAALLTACAPMPTATEANTSAVSSEIAQRSARQGTGGNNANATELLARMAPAPLLWPDAAHRMAVPSSRNLYELTPPEVDQQGIASWYGPGFHGRKTANGERFNQYELTAAHPSYEFGTQLCVRSVSTGQSVVVRVNDRGPFAKNRVIDLSKAAAEEIGMLGQGVKSVEIYKLDEGEDSCPEAILAASQ